MSDAMEPSAQPSAPLMEAAFLGGILTDGSVLPEVMHVLAPEDFSEAKHAHVWRAILACNAKGLPVDDIHVPEEMKVAGVLMGVGGPGFVMSLGTRPDGAHSVRFARELVADARVLADMAVRRRVAQLSADTAARAADMSVSLDSLLTAGASAFGSMHASAPHLKEGQDLFREVVEEVEAAGRGELSRCLATGIEAIDENIAGLTLAELTFFLSQPGVGKSTVFGSIIRNLARRAAMAEAHNLAGNLREGDAGWQPVDDVGVFSKEDLGTWIPRRLLAEASGIPLFVLQKGFARTPFTDSQMSRFGEATGSVYVYSSHYVVDDRNMLTVDQVIQSAREMKRRRERMGRKLRVCILDHIGKMDHEIAKHGGKEDLAIEHTLNKLSQFGKQEGIAWGVAVHGKERDDGAKYLKPKLNSFARTAYFERDARVALGFYLDKDDDSVILGTVLKQTNGPPDVDFKLLRAKEAAMVHNSEAEARYGGIYLLSGGDS